MPCPVIGYNEHLGMKLKNTQNIKMTLMIAYHYCWFFKLFTNFVYAMQAYTRQAFHEHTEGAHDELMEMQTTAFCVWQYMEIKPCIRQRTNEHQPYKECD